MFTKTSSSASVANWFGYEITLAKSMPFTTAEMFVASAVPLFNKTNVNCAVWSLASVLVIDDGLIISMLEPGGLYVTETGIVSSKVPEESTCIVPVLNPAPDTSTVAVKFDDCPELIVEIVVGLNVMVKTVGANVMFVIAPATLFVMANFWDLEPPVVVTMLQDVGETVIGSKTVTCFDVVNIVPDNVEKLTLIAYVPPAVLVPKVYV